jgi:hypothetical protein
MEKIFVLRLTCSRRKRRHDRRRTTRNPDDKLARNHNHRLILNCNATDGPDLQGRGKYEATEGFRVSKTWWLLLKTFIGITTGRQRPEGTTTTTDHVDYLYFEEPSKDGLKFINYLSFSGRNQRWPSNGGLLCHVKVGTVCRSKPWLLLCFGVVNE